MAKRTKILNGKILYHQIQQKIARCISEDQKRVPTLCIILIGNDPASVLYVSNKRIACEKTGISIHVRHLPTSILEPDLIVLLQEIQEAYDAVLIQYPIPKHLSQHCLLSYLHPQKDVDGLTPMNMGLMAHGSPQAVWSCTVLGIKLLLQYYLHPLDLEGKHVVIVNDSNIIGKPALHFFNQLKCTATLCHQHTTNLMKHVQMADIILSATGQSDVILGDWIPAHSIVIDAGCVFQEGRLRGDINYDHHDQADWITPVPGGVGPMTIAALLMNIYSLSRQKQLHFEDIFPTPLR